MPPEADPIRLPDTLLQALARAELFGDKSRATC